jgi:hypothetical protein
MDQPNDTAIAALELWIGPSVMYLAHRDVLKLTTSGRAGGRAYVSVRLPAGSLISPSRPKALGDCPLILGGTVAQG